MPEQVVACGKAINTSGGAAAGWIETSSAITPFRTDVTRGGEIPVARLVLAGTIVFSSAHELRPGERIRLFSLVPPENGTSLRMLFARDVLALDKKSRMPAGLAVALLLDEKDRLIAVSRPFRVEAGAETAVWPERADRTGGSLVAWLKRPRATERDDQDRAGITAADSTGNHRPDALVNAADSIVAVWYNLSGPTDQLIVDSTKLRLSHDRVDLFRGTATLLEADLALLPSLTVAVAPLSREVSQSRTPISLSITSEVEETKTLHSQVVEPGKSYTIESLPVAMLILNLSIDDFEFQQRVDLTSGEDKRVAVALNPLTISGTVYLGDVPARAQVRFLQKGKPLIVETDSFGSYQATLWQPRRYIVETMVAGRPTMPAFAQDVPITSSQRLDIHVPATSLSVRVHDSTDGKPVDGARVVIHNRWSDTAGSSSSMTSVVVKGEITELPPLRAGTAEIRVHAAGYSDAGPIAVPVQDGTQGVVIDIPMTRDADVLQVEIQLGGGLPAAGAEMAQFSGEQVSWHGTADESGRIVIPRSILARPLLVRHPSAASNVVLLPPVPDNVISLETAAPPLIVKVIHRDPSYIGGSTASVSLWLGGGRRLSGAEASFATWSLGQTSPDGTFMARGLPPRPIRMFATRNASASQIRSGTFDALASTIPYPWPAVATLPLADE